MNKARHVIWLLLLTSGYFTVFVRGNCSVTSKAGNCTTNPKAVSGTWFSVKAQSTIQDNDVSFIAEMEESCNELPLKVDVQVKAHTGSDFIFPGSGITQRTDDSDSPYGGVVYKYKADSSIRIMVPKRENGKSSGITLFSGGSSWDGVIQVNETAADVRYRVWCRCNFPTPAFESSWTNIDARNNNFLEINHGLGIMPDMVIVQLRHGSTDRDWVSDVMGSMSTSRTGKEKSGLIYAYNSRTVRIWAPENGNLFNLADGWGLPRDVDTVISGQLKVYVWSYLMNTKSKSVTIDRRTSIPNLQVPLPVPLNIDHDILYFTISPTNGENRGFAFPGVGSVQNADTNTQYGGVMYSYSSDKIRLWHPKLDGRHFLVYVSNDWGGGHHTQSAESVTARISVWKAGQICLIPPSHRTTPKTTTFPVTTLKPSHPSMSLGNASARDLNKKELWYDRSVTVPVLWLVVGGGGLLLLIFLLAIIIYCICKENSSNEFR
ncbi:uncharacterized protein LOC133196068 [Saccostrea echinata]|uniref:uncharacterized protein LOC133196068 n=1 Tax=Saccostrea echinata TaxID=191078 RepID=UPI002A82F42A|nr:uncharacterized protein LOC133196068 [Saccostrea echinata]